MAALYLREHGGETATRRRREQAKKGWRAPRGGRVRFQGPVRGWWPGTAGETPAEHDISEWACSARELQRDGGLAVICVLT